MKRARRAILREARPAPRRSLPPQLMRARHHRTYGHHAESDLLAASDLEPQPAARRPYLRPAYTSHRSFIPPDTSFRSRAAVMPPRTEAVLDNTALMVDVWPPVA